MRTLKTYKNISPNLNNGQYYHFMDFSDYLIELGTPYQTFELSDYRIVNNVIELATDSISADSMEITYMIEEDGSYHRCYHVESVELEASSIRFYLSVDLWGTYFDKASFSNMIIGRTTRNIGNGIYPEIFQTFGQPSFTELSGRFDLSCVVAIEIQKQNGLFTKASELELYRIPLSSSEDMKSFLSNLGKIKEISYDLSTKENCGVINVWITETRTLNYESSYAVLVYDTLSLGNYYAYKIKPSMTSISIGEPTHENKAFYVGTRYNNMKVKSHIESASSFEFRFIASNSDFKVIVAQGDTQKDITEAFHIALTSNALETTNTKEIAKAINTFGNVVMGIGRIESGDIVGGSLSTFNTLASIGNKELTSRTIGGDALSTFWDENGTRRNPYILVKYEGICYDDYTKIGCYFNIPSSFSSLFNASLITGCTKTFLQAEVNVEEIPVKAITYIRERIRSGIYIKRLT